MPTTTVTDSASLTAALQNAHGGDTILLAAGNYSGLLLQNLNFTTNVTIASADPTHAAVVTDMNVLNSTGLTFVNMTFSSDPAVPGVSAAALADGAPFRVTYSNNVVFSHDSFHGSLDNDPSNDRSGLYINQSNNVTVANSEFQQLSFGLAHTLSTNLVVTGNNFHDIRSDGVHGSSSNIAITNNYFHDFYPVAGDHPDAIQFFNELPDQAPHDITIANNLVVKGAGGYIEGAFLRLDDNFPAKFANVSITDNTFVGTMYNGITVINGQNLDIERNNLVTEGDMTTRVWVGLSNGVTIANNQAGAFIYGSNASQSFTPTFTNTNITTTNDVVTAATTDLGASAISLFDATHSIVSGLDTTDSLTSILAGTTSTLGVTLNTSTTSTTSTSTSSTTNLVTTGSTGGTLSTLDSGTTSSAQLSAPITNVNVSGSIQNFYPYIAPNSGAWTHSVTGGSGADKLAGTSANDFISGGAGADTMTGGAGDDTYVVDSAGDKVVEAAGGGVDTVWSQISSYTLPSNVENLQLRGTGVQTGIGNSLNNVLEANTNNSSVLNGMGGNDMLLAGHGSDTLTGGAGADVFTFVYMPTTHGGVITDFTPGTDVLDLRGIMRNVVGYQGTNPIADGHLILTSDGHGGTNVMIDVDGYAGPKAPVLITDLQNVAPTSLSAGHDWIFA